MNLMNAESQRLGIKINIKKTETLVAAKQEPPPRCNITINNTPIQQREKFTYLGCIITEDGRSTQEIERRIAISKNAFSKMKNLLCNSRLNLATRIRTLKAYIWATLLYGSETWTLNKNLKRKLEATEMWFYRRMLRISWVDRITNVEVLRRMNTQRLLLANIRKRQLNFLGHILRAEKIEHLCITGRIEGRRGRGRQRIKFLDSICEEAQITRNALIQMARDRLRWREMTAYVYDTALR